MEMMIPNLKPNLTPGAGVTRTAEGAWHCEIPAGPRGRYRLAQLDDYRDLPRRGFPWRPPLRLSLRARVSAEELPGTWGFGLWNDPFSVSFGLGGMARRFPALPNAAWFFYASPPNYLSFRNDLPAQGFLAATFRAAAIPAPLLALGSPVMALAVIPLTARLVRRLLRAMVAQGAALVPSPPPQPSPIPALEIGGGGLTAWRTYTLDWQADSVSFGLDGATFFETPISPRPPMSLVLWIDNQYAALPPRGRLSYGVLLNPEPAWLEIADLHIG